MPDELELGKNFAQKVAADLVHTEERGVAAILQNRLQKLYRTAKDKADASQPGAVLTYEDYRELASDSSAVEATARFSGGAEVEGITADDRTIYGELVRVRGGESHFRVGGGKQDNHAADLLGKMLKVNLLTPAGRQQGCAPLARPVGAGSTAAIPAGAAGRERTGQVRSRAREHARCGAG
jgi:hypothetical protein